MLSAARTTGKLRVVRVASEGRRVSAACIRGKGQRQGRAEGPLALAPPEGSLSVRVPQPWSGGGDTAGLPR